MSIAQSKGAFLVLVAMSVAGCEHAIVGNATALVLTLGLFVGTLQLGRQGAPGAGASEVASAQSRTARRR